MANLEAPSSEPAAEPYTCRLCRREYDSALERCPQCKAWQGDNFVMADEDRPARRAALERRASAEVERRSDRTIGAFFGDLLWQLGASGVLLLVGVGLLLAGYTIAGWVVLGFIVLPVVLGMLELFE